MLVKCKVLKKTNTIRQQAKFTMGNCKMQLDEVFYEIQFSFDIGKFIVMVLPISFVRF